MKPLSITLLLLCTLFLTSCQAIAGIFSAGAGVGVLLVLGVISLIIFFAARVSGK